MQKGQRVNYNKSVNNRSLFMPFINLDDLNVTSKSSKDEQCYMFVT